MNALVLTKESVAKAVTEDIVKSINEEAPAPISVRRSFYASEGIGSFKEPAFERGNPRVVIALDRLECTVSFKAPETSRFQELVHEILMLPTYAALETLADVTLGIRPGYTKTERICASQIHAAI